MAFLFIDGFDSYRPGTTGRHRLQPTWLVASPEYASFTAGTYGGQRLVAEGTSTSLALWRLFSPKSEVSFGACINVNNVAAVDNPISVIAFGYANGASLSTTTNMQVGVQLQPDGSIRVQRITSSQSAGTTLATSAAGVVASNTDCYIEGEIVFSNTVGRVKIVANGTTVIDTPASLDTAAQTGELADYMFLRGQQDYGLDMRFDDVWANDSASIPPGGPFRVQRLVPTADGATTEWTPSTGTTHFDLLDETPVGDTDYVFSSTPGHVDELVMADMAASPSTIAAVQLSGYVRNVAMKPRSVALDLKSGATTDSGAAVSLLASAPRIDRIFETDPATSAAWSTSGVNGLRARARITA